MQGNAQVDKIMNGLYKHIKDGCDETNKPHSNYVYEAIMNLVVPPNGCKFIEEFAEDGNIVRGFQCRSRDKEPLVDDEGNVNWGKAFSMP